MLKMFIINNKVNLTIICLILSFHLIQSDLILRSPNDLKSQFISKKL